ncbi:MAG TPA: LCP family protein [Solirubrobacterales bacterium]|nr:LCP family protein [Solirubrobacterales bacterium]
MTPPKKRGSGGGNGKDEEPRADETQEFELGADFLEDQDDQEADEERVEGENLDEEELDDEDLPDEDYDDEDYEDYEDDEDEEDELEHVVSAETQEWDGLEAAEAEADADQPTLVASAGQRVSQAQTAITSGFEKVGGKKVTSGFKAVRRHVGFPVWLRFLTASFVIVAAVAGATSASLILYLSDIANALKNHSEIQGLNPFLARTTGSGPQTILIIGSDKRNNQISGQFGLSDTTMLLRLDPDRNAIALLSLPRDLKVDIPGVGTDKLNAAYSLGGPKLTLRTVKDITGLPVNHLVNVDFTGFARAVNAIGCVYVDVDRRYYIAPNTGTSEINLQPGYQALCGFDALSFARYRHTDNDIVRAARQQTFLREARAKVPPSKLIEDRKKLVKIFTTYTSSDIGSAEEMLQVLRLFFDLRSAPIKEIHFNGTLGPSYVTATPDEIHTAVNQFLGVQGTPGPAGSSAQPKKAVTPQQPPDHTKSKPATKKKSSSSSLPSTLTRTTYGRQLAQAIRARKEKVPVYYPTVLESGSDYAQKPRVYKINGKGDGAPPHDERAAYKWVFSLPTLGDYYGFQGTRWTNPPILSNPSEERTIGDRDYKLYFDGDRLRMVAWQTEQGSFWLSNSLIETVPNADMLKIAVGFRQLPGT